MSLYKLLHLFSVIVWVGGMFFAYLILRPAIGQLLKLPERMRLWDRVLSRFFNWVWLAVFLLLSTGFYMIYLTGGMAAMHSFIHLMLSSGIVMMLIFIYLFFNCYVHFSQLVEEKEWHLAELRLTTIRKLVAVNLVIGLLTVAVAMVGRS
jgi:uncharacterized membrane protein